MAINKEIRIYEMILNRFIFPLPISMLNSIAANEIIIEYHPLYRNYYKNLYEIVRVKHIFAHTCKTDSIFYYISEYIIKKILVVNKIEI